MKNKRKLKRKFQEIEEKEDEAVFPPSIRHSDEPVKKKVKWVNKQRVLVVALRGGTHLHRHLMQDLKTFLPHSKKDNKVEKSSNLSILNEIAESKNCNKSILFETRRKKDLYMWISDNKNGPCAKFEVENIYTMKELKLTGNCLKGSRPLLTFDESFTKQPHYQLLRELFTQVFSTPYHHPKSQPFIDHVFTFTVLDNKIWFRNYQILSEDGALAEIGPRFVLNPIKIFSGSFGGEVLWDNPNYVSTAMFRRMLNKKKGNRYLDRKQQKEHFEETRPEKSYNLDSTLEMFQGSPLEKAEKIVQEKVEDKETKKTKKINLGRKKLATKKKMKKAAGGGVLLKTQSKSKIQRKKKKK